MPRLNRRDTIVLLGLLITLSPVVMALAQSTTKQKAQNTVCLSNMKQLGIGILTYAQDYDETLPPVSSAGYFTKVTTRYMKSKSVFICPASKKPYVLNRNFVPDYIRSPFSFPLAAVLTPSKTVIMYDPKPHADRSVCVTYLDGHAKRETKLPALGLQ
jgi:hypothetical protein